ncbi:alpha-ketoglutarate-dependent dioxygenase alkB homolog 3-like [Lytechinus pictus]|uniref:alpha-ketoglutarate-dependent dioxygenase alkB homolog 3-like n=1 Tax=Lytechinus pictus TaxID=7653 RepID=UPI0030BA191D
MADNKRQRARIQGSWAAPPSKGKARGRPTGPGPGSKPPSRPGPNPNAVSMTSKTPETTTSPTTKGQSDCLPQTLTFTETGPIRRIPEPKEIVKDGSYVISVEPGGEARITLTRDFLLPEEADYVFATLRDEIPWAQKQNCIQGQTFDEPRLTCWFGEYPYAYTKVRWEKNTDWNETLLYVKSRIEEKTGQTFNSCLLNYYRSGKDHVSWHSDDEPSLGSKPAIASVSLGDSRTFEMRKKPPPEENGDYTYTEKLKIPLTHGSLLMMEGASQDDWQHQIPREYHDRDARINLTFRTIFPE